MELTCRLHKDVSRDLRRIWVTSNATVLSGSSEALDIFDLDLSGCRSIDR
jgi:hypothetical protein